MPFLGPSSGCGCKGNGGLPFTEHLLSRHHAVQGSVATNFIDIFPHKAITSLGESALF